jgi:hypothetical protein
LYQHIVDSAKIRTGESPNKLDDFWVTRIFHQLFVVVPFYTNEDPDSSAQQTRNTANALSVFQPELLHLHYTHSLWRSEQGENKDEK